MVCWYLQFERILMPQYLHCSWNEVSTVLCWALLPHLPPRSGGPTWILDFVVLAELTANRLASHGLLPPSPPWALFESWPLRPIFLGDAPRTSLSSPHHRPQAILGLRDWLPSMPWSSCAWVASLNCWSENNSLFSATVLRWDMPIIVRSGMRHSLVYRTYKFLCFLYSVRLPSSRLMNWKHPPSSVS